MISTQNLDLIPDIENLRLHLQSLATLDLLLTLDDGGAYYDFDSKWSRKEQVAKMDNGSGDYFFAHFSKHGCLIKGFAHESQMSPFQNPDRQLWPGLVESIPDELESARKEPAFDWANTTFAIWRLADDHCWKTGVTEFSDEHYGDGSGDLLQLLDGRAKSYREWAEDYYEMEVDEASIQHIIGQLPLNDDLVKSLNPLAKIGKLKNALVRIGYPGIRAS